MEDARHIRPSRTRRTLLAAGAVAPLVIGAASCTSGAGPGQAGPAPADIAGSIDVSTWAGGSQLAWWEDGVRRFEEKHAPARATLIRPPTGTAYPAMLIAMTAAGTPPDVLWVNNDQVAQFASQDLVQALESFINRDKRDLGAYYPFGLRVYQFQGKQVCIPESLNPMGIFINRTLFEQAGVPLPTRSFRDSAWTADDLLEAAKKLTRSTQAGKQFGFMVDNWIGRWFPFLWGNGGDAFDDANNPKRFTFVSPQTEQTLQWLVDLKTRHQVSPQPAELQGTSMATLFAEGRLAMRLDGIWVMPELDQVEGLKWDVVPVTRGPAGRFTRMAGAGLGLHPGSKNKETAWAFVKFLSGPEAPPLTRDITVKIPPVKAAAESARFMDWLPAETKKLWLEAHEYSKIQAHHLKWQDVMEGDGARKFYTEALNGERPVKDALEQVKTHAQAHLQ